MLNADEKIPICKERIAELKAKAEADRLERERDEEIARKERERRARVESKEAEIAQITKARLKKRSLIATILFWCGVIAATAINIAFFVVPAVSSKNVIWIPWNTLWPSWASTSLIIIIAAIVDARPGRWDFIDLTDPKELFCGDGSNTILAAVLQVLSIVITAAVHGWTDMGLTGSIIFVLSGLLRYCIPVVVSFFIGFAIHYVRASLKGKKRAAYEHLSLEEREQKATETLRKHNIKSRKNAKKKKIAKIVAGSLICVGIASAAAWFVIFSVVIPNRKYKAAVDLIEVDVIKAYESLIALDGHKDSAEKAKSIFEQYKTEKMKVANVGDFLYFGVYEQDNKKSNGKEPIEWLVLDKKDGKILVISRYALDCRHYNSQNPDTTWAKSYLRPWLNNTFFDNAFSSEEQAMVELTTLSADVNPAFITGSGTETQDRIFLLGIKEANKYFGSVGSRMCGATDYAIAQGAAINDSHLVDGKGSCSWWLRTPGIDRSSAAVVFANGNIKQQGRYVGATDVAVRPAMWINLDY